MLRNAINCICVFTHADRSREGMVIHRYLFVCLSVCLFFRTISSQYPMQLGSVNSTHKTFSDESSKFISFGVKKLKVKVTSHKKTVPAWVLHSCECWLRLFFILVRLSNFISRFIQNNHQISIRSHFCSSR